MFGDVEGLVPNSLKSNVFIAVLIAILGIQKLDSDSSSPGQSSNRRFRNPASFIHPTSSSLSTFVPSSERLYEVLKEYANKLLDINIFTMFLEIWVRGKLNEKTKDSNKSFISPFSMDELHTFDFALDGIPFRQLFRMPSPPNVADNLKEDEYLALENFLQTAADGLWHAFWHQNKPFPFFISSPHYRGSKFYTVEKAISRGILNQLCGTALLSESEDNLKARWDCIVHFLLFRHDITNGMESQFSVLVVCEALFYAVHILLSRNLSKTNTVASNYVYMSVLDTKFGGVVKLSGDFERLEIDLKNPYQSMAEWIARHAEVSVSSVDCIWNKLGNVNWGDFGTVQILYAIFHSISQWNGPPRRSMASLAANHSLLVQKQRTEGSMIENESIPNLQGSSHDEEIVELEYENIQSVGKIPCLKFSQGDVVSLEDQNLGIESFQIQEILDDENRLLYIVSSMECPTQLLNLYVGAHLSRLEPSWENMKLWYQVQRQTKVLNILKDKGVSSKHLPEIVASGRLVHSGYCEKQSPRGRCDHPWCGTPMLVICPVGEPVSSLVSRLGTFSVKEALRCCRDCIAALRSAKTTNVMHGDICPENILCICDNQGVTNNSLFVTVSWGHAVLDDRDSAPLNLQFSSTHALQHGKLCPSSDVESLIYVIYYVSGGTMLQQDSIESALEWRQKYWSKRVFQHKLGEVSPLLKAFADYVDNLCGTPYKVDYDVWLKKFNRSVDSSIEKRKSVEEVSRLKDDTVSS